MNSVVYPELFMIGVYERFTPELTSQACLIATIVASFLVANRVMRDRGVDKILFVKDQPNVA